MSSKSFGSKSPAVPHLLVGAGGISGEVQDLRKDVEEAFSSQETPGHGGTNLIAVDEWTAPLAADAAYVLAAGAIAAAATTLTAMTHATIPHARNLTITCDSTGTGEGNIVITGTDVNGAVLSETFAVPAGDAVVTGVKAFKTVTSVLLPAKTVGMTALAITIGVGDKFGLGSKAKLRNGVAAILAEYLDGVQVHSMGSGAATAVNQTTVATNTATTHMGYARFTAPLAGGLTGIVNTVDCADGVRAIAAQIVTPRRLQVRMVQGGVAITAGTCTLVGVGLGGEAISEVIDITGGTKTVVTAAVFATLTSATVAGQVGGGAGTTIGIGPHAGLALPVPAGAGSLVVRKVNVDAANEAVAGVDATLFTVSPTTAANGAHNYDVWFTYTLTSTQNTHNHTQNAHTHTGAAGTFAIASTGLPNGTFLPGTVANAAHNYVVVYERDLT